MYGQFSDKFKTLTAIILRCDSYMAKAAILNWSVAKIT